MKAFLSQGVGLAVVSGFMLHAGELRITPQLISGGGGHSEGGRFAATGSVGQPIAGAGFESAGGFQARVGYWSQILPWINVAPVATPDVVSRRSGEGAHILIRHLLSNDYDADYDVLTFAGFDNVSALGGAVFRDGPWLIYQPPTGVDPTAEDSFTYFVTDSVGAPVGGTVRFIPFVPPDSGSPNALAVEFDPGPPALVRVRFQAIAGRAYLVQAAEAITGPWEPLGLLVAEPNGRLDFVEIFGPGPRFYRLVESPE